MTVPYGVIRWGVKPAMDLLYRVGRLAGPGRGVHSNAGTSGPSARISTERAPVDQRPWEDAIRETIEWYETVGLL
ncbi:MAG: hypothetical protein U5K28_05325 [Halobacteriales archaeon]|nr:hypothetical protein [Halobacteriales archaeon]